MKPVESSMLTDVSFGGGSEVAGNVGFWVIQETADLTVDRWLK
jgi:hypothetical protein